MNKKKILLIVFAAALAAPSCTLLQALGLASDLLLAIESASEGEKLCAVFDVLDNQQDAVALSALLNVALSQLNSDVSFTPEAAQTLIELTRVLDCDFLSCFAQVVVNLDPPDEDAPIREWVQARIEFLADVAECGSQRELGEDDVVQLVRLIVDFDLS